MRKFLLVSICTAAVFALSTNAYSQIKIGPEAGVNFAMQAKSRASDSVITNESRNSNLKVGALAGINIDIKVLKNLYVQSGILYAYDNIKFKNDVDYTAEGLGVAQKETQDKIHYFKIPVYVMYKSGFEGSGRFIAGIGPYVGYAFLGNRSIAKPELINDSAGNPVSYATVKSYDELSLGNDATDDLRNWDYGMNACIGYEANVGMYFRGSFNYGFQNLLPAGGDSRSLKNWGFGVTVGFNIGSDTW